jgi:hypothetical protein
MKSREWRREEAAQRQWRKPMSTEVAIAEQSQIMDGVTGQAPQNGEIASPLFPLALAELPPNLNFIASKTEDEKIQYIQSIIARSEDEAIAIIAPALQFYGSAGSVVEAYMPLILEVKKRVCSVGRPRINPATGERNRTWEEICEENFHIGIRRMQQLLSGLKVPRLRGNGGAKARRSSINRKDYERAKRVATPARSLAEQVVSEGLGNKFPEAMHILKLANVPVPDVQPDPIPRGVDQEPDWKSILVELVDMLVQHGDTLPMPVITALKDIQKVLGGKVGIALAVEKPSKPISPTAVPKKKGRSKLSTAHEDHSPIPITESGSVKESLDVASACPPEADSTIQEPGDTSTADQPEQTSETAPTTQPRRSVELVTVEGKTVKPGYTCKYQGIDWKVMQVWNDETVSLERLQDGKPVSADAIPASSIRYALDPKDKV